MDALVTRYNQEHRKFPDPNFIDLHVGTGTRFYLGETRDSWIDLWYSKAAETIDFDELWDLHPEERGTIAIFGRETKVPRWQQSYERGYYFSGMMHEALPLPDPFRPFLDEIRKVGYGRSSSAGFNEILVNWYQDGSDYIGPHSDDERQMVRGPGGESVVYSLTLQETPGNRIFRLKPKVPKKGALPEADRKLLGKERIDVQLQHGLVVMMGGLCQVQYKHQVPATKSRVGRRINVTMRCFQDDTS